MKSSGFSEPVVPGLLSRSSMRGSNIACALARSFRIVLSSETRYCAIGRIHGGKNCSFVTAMKAVMAKFTLTSIHSSDRLSADPTKARPLSRDTARTMKGCILKGVQSRSISNCAANQILPEILPSQAGNSVARMYWNSALRIGIIRCRLCVALVLRRDVRMSE